MKLYYLHNHHNYAGVVTLPMTFMTRTPVDCVIHPSMWQPNSSSTHIMDSNQLVSML